MPGNLNVLAQAKALIGAWHRDTHFLATVSSVSGNRIFVLRDGQTAADPLAYAAAAGLAAAVIAGDRVLVVDATGKGGYVVVCEVVS